MKTYKQHLDETYLAESINDKNLFKAVMMAGGPGSGKSFIVDAAFKGITNAKFINSDVPLVKILTRLGLPQHFDTSKKDQYAQQMVVRDKAKKITKSQYANAINGMLPIVIDGTGKKKNEVKEQAEALRKIGYDVAMVMVDTSLDIAKERNEKRKKRVPDAILTKSWKQVQDNVDHFENFFGKQNFLVVVNNERIPEEESQKFIQTMTRAGMKLLKSKLQNPQGIKVINTLKKTGGKYLSDLTSGE